MNALDCPMGLRASHFGRRQGLREGQGDEDHSSAQKRMDRDGWVAVREPASWRRKKQQRGEEKRTAGPSFCFLHSVGWSFTVTE